MSTGAARCCGDGRIGCAGQSRSVTHGPGPAQSAREGCGLALQSHVQVGPSHTKVGGRDRAESTGWPAGQTWGRLGSAPLLTANPPALEPRSSHRPLLGEVRTRFWAPILRGNVPATCHGGRNRYCTSRSLPLGSFSRSFLAQSRPRAAPTRLVRGRVILVSDRVGRSLWARRFRPRSAWLGACSRPTCPPTPHMATSRGWVCTAPRE